MNFRSWLYALRQAFAGVFRSGLLGLASVATVMISLLVLSVVLLLAVNLERMAQSVESQVEIRAYLHDGLSPAVQQGVTARIQSLTGVARAGYVSKEEALERMKEDFGEHQEILEAVEEMNPLRDSVEIQVTDPALVGTVAAAVARVDGVAEVDFGRETVERLLGFTRAVRLAGLGLVALLVLATVFTISNTIRLAVFSRRREITIMKLVGATDWFIRRPFLLEGMLLGGLGAALAMLLTTYGYRWLVDSIYQNLPFLPVVGPDDVLKDLTVGLITLGCGLGVLGSWISLRRFLKV